MNRLVSQTSRRKIAAALMAWLLTATTLWTTTTPTARAFVPTNFKAFLLTHPSDETHESISKSAIKDLDNEFFSITRLTNPMKKAINQIADADAAVDDDQTTSAKHFDGESFPEGQARVVGLFQDVIDALNNDNPEGARSKLGQALHTIQDFYAHSNWVELGNGGANPDLGRPGHALNRLGPEVATCRDCTPCLTCNNNLITTQLTSGYYGGEDRVKPNAGKCSHGGPLDSSASGILGAGINKDSEVCVISPHAAQHFTAAAAANAATKQFIRDIKDRVTMRRIKQLLGVGPTLAISIDTTGSMGSIINSVKQQAIAIVDARLGTDEEPSKYVLAPFNDPGVGPVTTTDDADTFKGAISSLFASGGDDCPELANSGMLQGLSACDEGGDLFMFTDASSKDGGLAGNVSSLATSKDIQVFPCLFGSCSPIDPSFIRIANESGGQLFFLFRSEAGAITRLADAVVRSNAVNLLSVADTFSGTAKTYTVPVDSQLSRVTFSVAGTTNVTVKRPDGSTVTAGDAGVSTLSLSGGMALSINAPTTGNWTVTINGSGNLSVSVFGESAFGITAFRFVRDGGRPGHESFLPITGFPLAGQTNIADAVLDDGFQTAQFELRSKAGDVLQTLSLQRGAGLSANEFLGNVTLPGSPFLFYVTGLDVNGVPYQRVLPSMFKPQTIKIDAPPTQDLRAGQTTSYVFRVQNLGAADSFRLTASDDQRFVVGVSATSFALAANATIDVTVQLRPPTSAPVGISDTLTVSVESLSASGASNFAVVRSSVSAANLPPDVSQAIASVTTLWPPNHQFAAVSVLGVSDPDGDVVSITIDRVMQDEPTNGDGDGNTCPDATGIGTATAQLRAERSGTGNGRVYTIFFTASDGKGGSTPGSVKVCVPHDRNDACVDDGPTFDSTNCGQAVLASPSLLELLSANRKWRFTFAQ